MSDRRFHPGEVVGERFELEALLGRGSFGAVWKARDQAAGGVPVAIKLLFDKYTNDHRMLGRFVQEAKILERLDHPNITRAIAWSGDPPEVYLAMKLVDGETLDARLEGASREKTPLPREGIAWIADQLAAAVSHAHQHGVVHRDLKPKNVMVNRRGARPFLEVLDFGIAKMLVGSEIDPTTVGRVLGSVLYISPEQVQGKPIDHRADIFALGTILFEVITLHRAWSRSQDGDFTAYHDPLASGGKNSHVSVLRRIARDPRPKASALRRDLPPAVDEVLAKAMAIKPEARFEGALELAKALRAALIAPARGVNLALQTSDTVVDRPPAEAELPTLQEDDEEAARPALPGSTDPTFMPGLFNVPVGQLGSPSAEPQAMMVEAVALAVEAAPEGAPEEVLVRPARRLGRGTLGAVLLAAAALIAALAYAFLGAPAP